MTLNTNKNVHMHQYYLTHFKPSSFLFPLKVLETLNYYTPWKHQKTFWCIRKLFLPCCTTGRPVIKSAMVQIQKIYLGTCKLNNFSDMKNVFQFSPPPPPQNFGICSILPPTSNFFHSPFPHFQTPPPAIRAARFSRRDTHVEELLFSEGMLIIAVDVDIGPW